MLATQTPTNEHASLSLSLSEGLEAHAPGTHLPVLPAAHGAWEQFEFKRRAVEEAVTSWGMHTSRPQVLRMHDLPMSMLATIIDNVMGLIQSLQLKLQPRPCTLHTPASNERLALLRAALIVVDSLSLSLRAAASPIAFTDLDCCMEEHSKRHKYDPMRLM